MTQQLKLLTRNVMEDGEYHARIMAIGTYTNTVFDSEQGIATRVVAPDYENKVVVKLEVVNQMTGEVIDKNLVLRTDIQVIPTDLVDERGKFIYHERIEFLNFLNDVIEVAGPPQLQRIPKYLRIEAIKRIYLNNGVNTFHRLGMLKKVFGTEFYDNGKMKRPFHHIMPEVSFVQVVEIKEERGEK